VVFHTENGKGDSKKSASRQIRTVKRKSRVEAALLSKPAWSAVAQLESQIAAAESVTNVIELHPQAVQRFKENIEALANILTTRDAVPDLDLIGTFRSLVERVVVHLRKPKDE
jgi:site-specific DNA recombinase